MSALLVIVIIGAASLIMAKGAAFLSIGELDMGRIASEGGNAYYAAESCLEEALLRIKRDENFTADNLELTINDFSCIINVSGAMYKNLAISGAYKEYRKSLTANVSIADGNVFLDEISFP